MAGSSLLTLIDDIATMLDDVSLMTKVAAKKTAGVLGDDLALNAQQVSGVRANRELPVVAKVALGSLVNKVILVPLALLISVWAPWAITPLLMVGGAYLCYEGFEKLYHRVKHGPENTEQAAEAVAEEDVASFEKRKIKGAVRTDFVLSAEIIAITLGTVATASFSQQVMVLVGIALLMTVGVYGLVAGIVKLDDLGLWLFQKSSRAAKAIGQVLLRATPYLMKTLSVVGTVAMFMVGGGILVHGVPLLQQWAEGLTAVSASLPVVGVVVSFLAPSLLGIAVGLVAGALVLLGVSGIKGIKAKA
ncbi:MAG: DUF808 domain-containing protein [Neisseriaceae bacterium]|nr:DUF808 domain-containing protein [Neisseriaceae bacterium]MBP6862197.1 DUF808 domain-containing protein [Neisseriaceae bacterium]